MVPIRHRRAVPHVVLRAFHSLCGFAFCCVVTVTRQGEARD